MPDLGLYLYLPPCIIVLADHMYCFEGKDYSKDPSSEDRTTFQRLLDEQLAQEQNAGAEGRSLRNKTDV